MRNDSTVTEANDILATENQSQAAQTAIAGSPINGNWTNPAGVEVDVAATPLQFGNVKWAVLAMQGVHEAYAGVTSVRNFMLMSGLALMLVTTAIAIIVSRSITYPVSALTNAMRALARSELETGVPSTKRGDEIGKMAGA